MHPGTGTRTDAINQTEVFERIRTYWLSSLVHDLASPLFSARGYVRLALEEREGPLPASYRQYLKAALENINRLVSLTREFGDGPDKDAFEFDIVDFPDLLRQVVEDVREVLPHADVKITNDSAESVSGVGDSRKLVLVLRSFLTSAVEFTGAGGKIEIHLREENGKTAVRFSAAPGSEPALEVPWSDLSAASKLWRLHGGSVSVQTQSDAGYSVTFELPRIRQSECL
jgi:signal transduction histidine kinase